MAIRTWNGGHASSNNWTEAANWGGTAPIAGDDLVFAGSTRLTPNNNFAADTSFNEITFDTGAGSFTLTGNRITVTGDIETKAVNPQTIALNMIFNATRALCPSFASGQITISGIISGAGGIDKSNVNTVVLSGLNTYTGKTTIVQGTLSINTIKSVSGGASSFGAPTTVANGTIELSGFGGNLKYTGSGDTTDRALYFSGGAGSTTCFVEQAGTGNLKFTSALTYANGAKTIEFKGSTAGTGEISGVIADTGSGAITLSKTGSGRWFLSGVNTYTGGTNVTAGILESSPLNNASFGTGTITLLGGNLWLQRVVISNALVNSNDASILTLDNGFASEYAGTITNNNILSIVPYYDVDQKISGAISGSGAINITGVFTGRVIFSGVNSCSGIIQINPDTILRGTNTSSFGTSEIKPRGGTLQILINGAGSGGTITFVNTITVNSTFTGTVYVANNGSNTDNTVIFPTLLLGGSNNALNVTGANGYKFQTTAVSMGGGGATTLNPTTANFLASTVTGGPADLARTLKLDGTSTGNIISGVISNGVNVLTVEKNNSSAWTLGGINTYTGTTTINAGTLVITGSTHASSAITVKNAAILAGNGTVNGSVTVENGGIVAPGVSSEATLNTGALTLNGTSVLNFGLGTTSDKIAVTGALTLDGTINVTAAAGFKPVAYLILTYTGALTNNALAVGTVPSGYYATVLVSGLNVYLLVSAGEQHSTNRGIRRGVSRGVG